LSYRPRIPIYSPPSRRVKTHRTPLTCRNNIGVWLGERLVPNILPKYSAAR
jgi:hypothetical protein